MPFERDPLSVPYDPWSRRMLARCIAEPGFWRSASVSSPPRSPIDERGLSREERAATRSLYYVLTLDFEPRAAPKYVLRNRRWSLQVDWGEPGRERHVLGVGFGLRIRSVLLRVVTYRSARDAIAGQAANYVLHPELRSRGATPGEADADDWTPHLGEQGT
jgi:hypothetical protein